MNHFPFKFDRYRSLNIVRKVRNYSDRRPQVQLYWNRQPTPVLSINLRTSIGQKPITTCNFASFFSTSTSSSKGLNLDNNNNSKRSRSSTFATTSRISGSGTTATTTGVTRFICPALFCERHYYISSSNHRNVKNDRPEQCHHQSSETTMPPTTHNTPLSPSEEVDLIVNNNHVVIFSMSECRFCTKAKAFLDEHNIKYREVDLDPETNGLKLYEALQKKVGRTSVPQIFVAGQSIGGCDDMLAMDKAGELMPKIRGHNFEYDLIVIGGGSGGLAASKEAAALGKKVALLDFVSPSPHGTTWGLGGTCVNVGCIPKKLMHHASLIGQELEDAHHFGWVAKTDNGPLMNHIRHDWNMMVDSVQRNIKSSNFGYRTLLRAENVNYLNAHGELIDPHTVKLTGKAKNLPPQLTANHIIVATGERPRYPADVEGAKDNAITSDDIFSLLYNPGKTLVIGASYVALECAGFLRGLGNDVSVMVRSIVLRGFDRQCSELIRTFMQETEKVRFIDTSIPKKIVRLEDGQPGRVCVTYENLQTKEQHNEEFNTVLFAIGRDPCTYGIGLDAAGVVLDKSGYIQANNEQTNVENIYAIGDILAGKPQLTPVAIEAGILLARRLYAGSQTQCDYMNVPTTVFTPIEYGCCGYTEEDAIQHFGADGIEVYHQFFTPTEWRMNYYDRPRCPMNVCYVKVITTRSENNDPKEERLLGFHYVGPNAGEVTQFVAAPLKLKATKADLDSIIGIHPTCAELFTTLTITKRSGKEPTQKGCCG